MTVQALRTTPETDLVALAETLGQKFAATAAEADETDSFVTDNYAALKTSGLVEAGVPRELGGGGADIATLAEMLRVLGRHCSSTALAFSMHTHQVAIPAWRWNTQKLAAVEPLLKRVAAERIVLLSSGGSDWIGGSGRAEKVEGGYRITARKVFTSGAEAGDLLMTLGMRGTGSHDVVIEGHVVPEAGVALKRKAGEWHPLFQIIAAIAFPLVYSAYLGVAESACAIGLDLARKRRSTHHVTELVGRMQTELKGAELARRFMVEATGGAMSAQSVNEVMTGKKLFTDHAIRAVELAMEAAGGAGFYRAPGLERRFRDIQGARYHPLQAGPQAEYAGAMALDLPVTAIF